MTTVLSGPLSRVEELQKMSSLIAPFATEEVAGLEGRVVADFYGGETRHGRELRLHSGWQLEVGSWRVRYLRTRWWFLNIFSFSSIPGGRFPI